MRNDTFVDTSGWLCFFVSGEAGHGAAQRFLADAIAGQSRLVTTNYVLTELVPLLSTRTRLSRPQTLGLVASLESVRELEIVHVTPELHQTAFELLQARPDKNWSWVDAASFLVMKNRGIREALTTDRHFTQAGLVALLEEKAPQ